jgi:hypothetical protein
MVILLPRSHYQWKRRLKNGKGIKIGPQIWSGQFALGKILLPLRESKEIASVCPTNSVLVLWTTPCQHLDTLKANKVKVKIKIKQSHLRPGQALSVPGI